MLINSILLENACVVFVETDDLAKHLTERWECVEQILQKLPKTSLWPFHPKMKRKNMHTAFAACSFLQDRLTEKQYKTHNYVFSGV